MLKWYMTGNFSIKVLKINGSYIRVFTVLIVLMINSTN